MIFVGIDVAKNKHDCCILASAGDVCTAFSFSNDRDGFDKLMSSIKQFSHRKDLSDVKIGLESTGHYSTNIANFLSQKRLCVMIFNPLQVSFARKASTLRKTKTDKSDAKFLATMLFSVESKPHLPTVSAVSELKILTRNRFRLIEQRSRLKVSLSRQITVLFPELPGCVYSVNQKSCYAMLLEFPTAEAIADAHITRLTNVLADNSKGHYGKDRALQVRAAAQKSIGLDSRAAGLELQQTIRLIQCLQTEIDAVDAEIRKIMDELDSPIMSVPGIGYVLGAIILAEIGNIENFASPAKLLSFAGLEPSVSESGEYVAGNTPMVKRGSKYLRWALLQAARLVAYRDETFHAYQQKKLSEGKHFFVVQGHLAKKLVRVLFHLLKHYATFNRDVA